MELRYNKNLRLYLQTLDHRITGQKNWEKVRKKSKGWIFITITHKKKNINKQGHAK